MFLTKTRLFLIASGYLNDSYYQSKYVPAPEIAERYKINSRALMPALVLLTHAGILRSRVGGKEPGFILSRNPDSITMLEILGVLEPNPCFTCCKEVMDAVNCDCNDKTKCKLFDVINSAITEVRNKLDKISLKEYCETREF